MTAGLRRSARAVACSEDIHGSAVASVWSATAAFRGDIMVLGERRVKGSELQRTTLEIEVMLPGLPEPSDA